MARKKKVEVLTDTIVDKKVKKPRKKRELTDEQRKAIGERLQKARKKKDPSVGTKNVHPSVLALPEDDEMSLKNVREWIVEAKHQALEFNKQSRARGLPDKTRISLQSKANSKLAYVRWLEYYIKSGDWVGDFIGEKEDSSVVRRCLAMAYDENGNPKRTVGVFYSDICCIWTREMEGGKESVPDLYDEPYALTDKQFTEDM